MQILYHEQKLNEREGAVYSLLHCENLEDLSFFIKTPTSIENSKWPILPMLSYMDVKSIDPCFPKEKFEDMGYVYYFKIFVHCKGLTCLYALK